MNLEEIRARAEAATEGPWWAWDRGVGWHLAVGEPADRDEYGRPDRLLPEGMRTDIGRAEDAEFIAHARADIPNLLALVDALTAENARLRRELDANEGAEDARLAVAEAREGKLTATLDAVRRLCQSYTPEPPPLFRNPTSQHGEGYNHGTRDMAEAVLGVLNSEEES